MKKDSLKIQTFGCKVNHYDSVLLKERLANEDLKSIEGKEIFILNTCSVTAEAGKEARRQAEKIKKNNPHSVIVVTGCGAQVETKLYEETKAIDLVVANSHKKNMPEILKNLDSSLEEKTFKSNIFKNNDLYAGLISSEKDRTRSFLKIQDGCNSFCTFCIIPFARGKSQSVSVKHLVEAVNKLYTEGVREVVLTGVHIGDYKDGDNVLEDLIEAVLKKTPMPRLRLTSIEPIELTDRLLDLHKEERMCSHFHISLQSVNSSVLKSMKRKYGRKEVESSFNRIAKELPNAFVGMDIIAGFPSETESDFEETYEVLKNTSWTKMHVFPYSPREGTYAYRSPNLERSQITRRAGLLRHLSDDRFHTHLQKQVGTTKQVLLYKTNNQKSLSRDYWQVDLPSSSLGGEQLVQIDSFNKNTGHLQASWV